MKIVLIGGHLNPLLSVLEILPKDTEVLVIARKYAFESDRTISLEYQILEKRKINIETITTGRFQRVFTVYTIFSFLKLPIGFFQALKILKSYKQDCIIGFGGYLQIPVVLAGYFLKIPIILHEQTLEAGLSNKICSFFAKKICISWESSRKFFPKSKTVLTGNPVRKFQISNFNSAMQNQISNKKLPLLYITGGSAGSHAINVLVMGCLNKLLDHFKIIHQCGDASEYRDFDKLQDFKSLLPQEKKERYILEKFIDPSTIGSILHGVDIVVSRSGINIVTELLFFRKPALLIPLPFSQKDEQMKNALFLKSLGFCEVIQEKDLDSEKLLKILLRMIQEKNKYINEVQKVNSLVNLNAAEKIIETAFEVVKLRDEKKIC